MKLKEFFNAQKNITFTDVDKLDLYQNILYKQTKKTSLKRSSFIYAKYAVYSTMFVMLLFGSYGIYFVNNNSGQDFNRFAIRSNTRNTVQADYIAQVIDAKGNFFIEHDGVITQTNNISNGDTILLKGGSQLAFEINSGAQSKIIGPAKLVIQKTHDEDYKLNLIYGDFIQMEGNKQKTQTIELAINDITVKQENKSQPINFKFVKDGNNQIVQNNGANIIVTKNNGQERTTTLGKQQVVAIQNNNIKLFANIDSFTKAVAKKDISESFPLTTGGIDSGINDIKEVSLLSLLNTQQTIENEITQEIVGVLIDTKEILDPSQDEKINGSLTAAFYTPELKEIEAAFIQGDIDAFNTAYAKLERRIQIIYQESDTQYNKALGDPSSRMQGLKAAIRTIKDTIDNKYDLPPKYIENLQNIEKTMSTIIARGYGSAPIKDITTTGATTPEITNDTLSK